MKKREKQDLIIIVPGIKTLNSRPKLERKFLEEIIDFTHLMKPVRYEYVTAWKRGLRRKNNKVIVMDWGRNLGLSSFYSAKRKLLALIDKHHLKYELKIVALSLGGKVAFDTVRELKEGKIKKLVLVAAMGIPDREELIQIPTLNLYANNDGLAKLTTGIVLPLDEKLRMDGKNIKNIMINIGHDGLCVGKKISRGKLKGKDLIKIVNAFLK